MTRKLKSSKQSPENGQITATRKTKNANKENKMAQNIQCTPGYGQNGQLQKQASPASQLFNCSQILNAPMGQFIMSTPSFQGQSFVSQLASPISPNHFIDNTGPFKFNGQ